VQPSPAVSGFSELLGIKAISRSDAWAVGAYQSHATPQPLIEHWNGPAWKLQHPAVAGSHGSILTAVTAVSATNAWAVGYALTASPSVSATLIEHWNGHSSRVQSTVNPVANCFLYGVAARSASDVWAVGGQLTGTTKAATLVEHWNGMTWGLRASPNPSPATILTGVAAVSGSDAWAVGSYGSTFSSPQHTLIERWNGHSWKIQATPN
jgi:hypothetical protein